MQVLEGAPAVLNARKVDCISIVHRFDSPYRSSSPFDAVNQILYANGYHLSEVADVVRKGGKIKKAHVVYMQNEPAPA